MAATECRSRYRADFALAIGATPTDAAAATEVPMALATAEGVIAKAASLAGHPSILKPRTAKQALNLLRLHLLRHAPPG
jgi:nicotinamide-nucleotide amidase